VVSFGTTPGCIRFVATLATSRGSHVTAILARRNRAVVTIGTTRGHCHVGVKLGWSPTGKALVASGTTSRRTDVISVFTGGFCTIMTTGAVGCTTESAVISFGTAPC
jgi:hypothetical protein